MVQDSFRRSFTMQPPLPRIPSRMHVAGDAVLAGVFFVAVQVGLQWVLYARNENGDVHWLTALFSGSLVALLVYYLREFTRRRRLATLRRFKAIAEANHHIRNALEAIQSRFYLMHADPEHTTELLESVNRIQWVLREVLPDVNE